MPRKSPLNRYQDEIMGWLSEGTTQERIVDNLAQLGVPTSRRSLNRAIERWGGNPENEPLEPGCHLTDDEATITSKPGTKLNTPEDLMLERGLDPQDWEVTSVTVNEWDSPTGDTMRQLKVHLRRRVPLDIVAPARIDGPRFQPRKTQTGEVTKVVLVGDQQAPYHDENLHDTFCSFLADYQPDQGVLIGDTIDLPDISRHPVNPERDATTQECIDAGYTLLRDYRESYEPTQWQKLAGNHDERLRRIVIDKVEKIYGLRRAQVPGEVTETPLLDVGHLLRLDELGIDYVRPNGDYEHTQVKLSPFLAARHGWIARKGSGSSALATLQHLGYSVVIGHSHRQSLVHHTTHDIDGNPTTLAACETGCMCEVDGLGYAVAPDWQQGCAVAEIWPDGTFKLDLVTFVNNTLYFRGKQY